MKKFFKFTLATFLLIPSVAFAQFGGIKGLIQGVGDIVQVLIGIATAAALLFFLWGLAKFILALGGDEKAVAAGKTFMIWGLVAMFVLVSVWGIIGFFQRELGIPNASPSGNLQSSSDPNWAQYPGGVNQNGSGAVSYPTPTLGGWRNPPTF